MFQYDYEYSFDHVDFLKRSWGLPKAPRPHFEATNLSQSIRNPQPQSFAVLYLSAPMSLTDGNIYFLPLMFRGK